ncbi:MAG: 2Fe-2S iron-sulfur cluster-binding protein [Candidatus Woesearchaeota archaeon]|jgi:ferredoxin|nr:2Fe-2S iron-sulfur cluster-binding protein [Candidatus Woesearchaeota archaeon]
MAKLIRVNDDEQTEKEVQDDSPIQKPCEELGVEFGCEDGICGTCIIDVQEGHDNLSPENEKEEDMGLEEYQRLGCQCKIKSGVVKFKY